MRETNTCLATITKIDVAVKVLNKFQYNINNIDIQEEDIDNIIDF